MLPLLVDDVVEEEGEYVSIGGMWVVVVVVVAAVAVVVVEVFSLLLLLSVTPVGGCCDMTRARFELDNEGDKLKSSSSAGRFFWPKNCVILPDMLLMWRDGNGNRGKVTFSNGRL